MNILLTNDDGIDAAGIWSLYNGFVKLGHNVWMVAPKFEKSAQSHAITTRDPLRIECKQLQVFSVSGTPADCVILAFETILKEFLKDNKIDLVVSGINAGQNLGDDILYSGTVAAAVEAACYGYKAIAISTTSYKDQYYDTATTVLIKLLDNGIMDYLGYREIVNINVPNVPYADIQGVTICQTGFRRYQNIVHTMEDHRGNNIYWLGGDKPTIDKSDFEIDAYAIKENKVSISPIKIDLNDYEKINKMVTSFNLVLEQK
jgi:5'-nucleotidase